MFDFWSDMTTPARALIALGMIGLSVAIYFLSGGRLLAYGLFVVGMVLLMFSGSGKNKGGYNF